MNGRTPWAGRRARERVAATLASKGTVCHLCGLPGATTADHIVPRSAGGSDDLDNLAPAHGQCNSRRRDMPLPAWFAKYPLTKRAPATRKW